MRSSVLVSVIVIAPCTAFADCKWYAYSVDEPFVCYAEFQLKEPIHLLNELRQLKNEIESAFDLNTESKTIELILFRNRRSYNKFLSNRYPKAAKLKALFVEGPDVNRVYVYRSRNFATDVRHECTHALLHNTLPFLPLWLDEGLAEYFEVPADQRFKGHSHYRSVRYAIRFGWRPNLKSLEGKQGLFDMQPQDYQESWAWVHFMLHGPPQAREVLIAYLKEIRSGQPPGRMSDFLSRRIPNADALFLKHFQDGERIWRR